jgi:hypothetical protein
MKALSTVQAARGFETEEARGNMLENPFAPGFSHIGRTTTRAEKHPINYQNFS